jgi:hypothetical protein
MSGLLRSGDWHEREGMRPSTKNRHLADLRARSGVTTEPRIYAGGHRVVLVVSSLEPGYRGCPEPRPANPTSGRSR